jgi:hypothetical protein
MAPATRSQALGKQHCRRKVDTVLLLQRRREVESPQQIVGAWMGNNRKMVFTSNDAQYSQANNGG